MINKIFIRYLIVFLGMNLGWGQCEGCNPGINDYFDYDSFDLVPCQQWVSNINDCSQEDLNVLQYFIDTSDTTLNMEMDFDGNQSIEPLELGGQVWENGRLKDLYCNNYPGPFTCGLSCEIPTEIENLTNLSILILWGNQLIGEIPSEIGNLMNLRVLVLHENQLTGEIPSEIGNLVNLDWFSSSENQHTGQIPIDLLNLTELDMIWLSNNQLSGNIPEIGNLTNLTYLYLNYNELTGEIPSSIGNLTNLTNLYLYNNEFTGEIPSSIGNLTNLTYLNINSNQITGEIPPEIGNLTNLTYLKLSNNQLSGEIPSEISNLTNLDELYLSNNQLSGVISNSICDLSIDWDGEWSEEMENQVYFFSISNNQLCPPYPECLTEVDLGYQDTSNCSMSISELTLPTEFTLHEPFPNPFNPTTSIQFSIPERSQTILNVYDIQGNLISTLLNQKMIAGHHQIEWNAEDFSSGTYFIRIDSGVYSDVKKAVLVK